MLKQDVTAAVEVLEQLQKWIEDRDGLATVPVASLYCTSDILMIQIGEVEVYNSHEDEDLCFEKCREEFLLYIASRAPFMAEACQRLLQADYLRG